MTDQAWPLFEEEKTIERTVEIAIQVNGRIRARMDIAYDLGKEDVLAYAKANESVAKELEGKSIVKEIYVPGRLVNIVVKK